MASQKILSAESCLLTVALSYLHLPVPTYLLFKSRVENHAEPARLSSVSFTLGIGYASFLGTLLTLQLSFFITSTTGDVHGLWEGEITFYLQHIIQ